MVPVSVESLGGQMEGAGTSTVVLAKALDKSAGGSQGAAVPDDGGDLAKRNGCILVDSAAAGVGLVWLAPTLRLRPPT